MKKCSNNAPDYYLLYFKQNSKYTNSYDLTPSSSFQKFRYFILSSPKQQYLINKGAEYVAESFYKGQKPLHTGLIQMRTKNFFFGDHSEYIKGKKKNSLMLFEFFPEIHTIRLFYFNHFNKKSITMKLTFLNEFINKILAEDEQKKERLPHRPELFKPTPNMFGDGSTNIEKI